MGLKKSWKHYSKHEAIAIIEAAVATKRITLDSFEVMAIENKSFSSQFYNRLLEKYKLIRVQK